MNDKEQSTITGQSDQKVTWGAAAAIILSILIYFLGQGVGGALVTLYPLLRGMTRLAAINWLETSITAQFGFVLITESLSITMLYLFLRYKGLKFKVLGFNRPPKLIDLSYSLAALGLYFVTIMIVISALSYLIPSLNIDQKQQVGFEQINSGLGLIITLISLVILPPVVEEIITRGFLYPGLKKHLPKALAIIFTSLLFAAAHLQFGSDQPLLWVAGVDTFILSIFLCQLKDITGNLWASIGLHMLKNGMAFVLLFLIPYVK